MTLKTRPKIDAWELLDALETMRLDAELKCNRYAAAANGSDEDKNWNYWAGRNDALINASQEILEMLGEK